MIDLTDTLGRVFSVSAEALYEVGPFRPIVPAAFENKQNKLIKVTGAWRMRLKNGTRFTALGSIKQYDELIKMLIRRLNRG